MTTHVHEPAEDTVRSADDGDRDMPDLRGEVRPRLLDPLHGAGVHPGALENPLALEHVDVGVGVPARRQRPAVLERALDAWDVSRLDLQLGHLAPDCPVSQDTSDAGNGASQPVV